MGHIISITGCNLVAMTILLGRRAACWSDNCYLCEQMAPSQGRDESDSDKSDSELLDHAYCQITSLSPTAVFCLELHCDDSTTTVSMRSYQKCQ